MSAKDDKMKADQAETRRVMDDVLAKHGWKLGTVQVRGAMVNYNLIHVASGRASVKSIPIASVLLWAEHDKDLPTGTPDGVSMTTLMLVAIFTSHVKGENAKCQ